MIIASTATGASTANNIVTVIQGDRPLGKKFKPNADGTVSKKTGTPPARATAVMHHVPTVEAFVEVLRGVGNDPNAALMLGGFHDIEVGEEFDILSIERLEKQLGTTDRSKLAGVHSINGRKTVARLKVNTFFSIWILLDRDVDEYTPPQFAEKDYAAWVVDTDKLVPGFAACDRVNVASSSARVLLDGVPVGDGNGHTFVRVQNPDDIERMRTALRIRAIELEMSWLKPRIDRTTGKILGQYDATIIDLSVFNSQGLVFESKPIAGKGLEVIDQTITVHTGTQRAIDTSAIPSLTDVRVQAAGKKLGLPMQLAGDGVAINSFNLRLDTPIELKGGARLTVEQMLNAGICHDRCQAPFRASESEAAFINEDPTGRPFVHDSGTRTNHYLNDDEWEPIRTAQLLAEFDDLSTPEAVAAQEAAAAALVKAKAARFTPEPWHQFANGTPPTWIVKGILPQAGLGVLYGESGSGKSFFTLDMVAAVARGEPWLGHKVTQGRVVYIAAEGVAGFRSRVKALAKHLDIEPGDMQLEVVSRTTPSLMTDDHKALAAAIGKCSIIVVDTLAQTTAGANENSGEDMGKALGHCKSLHEATGALVLLVHHTGKDHARGARGWSGLRGACDVEIEISKGNLGHLAKITKQKDGDDNSVFAFKLDEVMIGVDEDGAKITSCVVRHVAVPKKADKGSSDPKGARNKAILEALDKVTELCDGPVPAETVIEEARQLLLAAGSPTKPSNIRSSLKTLVEGGFLVETKEGLGRAKPL